MGIAAATMSRKVFSGVIPGLDYGCTSLARERVMAVWQCSDLRL